MQVGRGGFQELDQIAIVQPFVKYAGRAENVRAVPNTVQSAVSAAAAGRPGAAYVDVPAGRLEPQTFATPPQKDVLKTSLFKGRCYEDLLRAWIWSVRRPTCR